MRLQLVHLAFCRWVLENKATDPKANPLPNSSCSCYWSLASHRVMAWSISCKKLGPDFLTVNSLYSAHRTLSTRN